MEGGSGAIVKVDSLTLSQKHVQAATTATPADVIPWVLNEVVRTDLRVKLMNDQEKRERLTLKRIAHYEAHADRLLDCWTEYKEVFPSVFADELHCFLENVNPKYPLVGTSARDKVVRLSDFLVELFAGDSLAHIKLGGKELWPAVLDHVCTQTPLKGGSHDSICSRLKKAKELVDEVHANLVLVRTAAAAATQRANNGYYLEGSETRPVIKNQEALGKRLEELQKVLREAGRQAEKNREKSLLRKAPWETKKAS